jgi:hypothetical protein
MMIHTRTSEWIAPVDENNPVSFQDSGGRLLVCKVKCKGHAMAAGSVYAPAKARGKYFTRQAS